VPYSLYSNSVLYSLMTLSDDDNLRLEDWKMSNDRVKYRDDTVMRTRIQGLPIATSIQAAAFTTLGAKIGDTTVGQTNVAIGDFNLAVFQLIIGAGLAYLIPVLLLDILHYKLLVKAAHHTKHIEKKYFKDRLSITTKLITARYTLMHTIGAYLIYGFIFVFGILFALFGYPEPLQGE
jgi:hypothetical protein